MPALQVILALMVAVAILATVARRVRLPYPIVLVLGGLGLGFVPGLPRVELAPDIVFLVFLPPLLFKSAWTTSIRDFRASLRPILLLAIGLVIFTTVGIALVAHALIPGLPWPAAFVLGAVVSPTDSVAAAAIMRRLGAPRPVVTIVEGESLVNDATGLVIYRFAVAAALTGGFVLWQAGLQFVLVSVGGIAMGLAVGWVLTQVQGRLEDPLTEITLSFLASYAAYLAAEGLHVSGVLAAVAAGLYASRRSANVSSASTRLQGYAVWEMAEFVLNGLAFILIGLQLPSILDHLPGQRIGELVLYGVAISLAVIVIRIVWFFPGAYLPRLLPAIRHRERRPPLGNVAVGSWAGMRGVVTLAAALALPAIPGVSFLGGRELVLFVAFMVILVTLTLQGLSLPWVLSRLGVAGEGGVREEKLARFTAIEAAESRLAELEGEEWAMSVQVDFIRGYYRKRRKTVETRFGLVNHEHVPGGHSHEDGVDQAADHRDRQESMRRLRLEMITAERIAVVRLRNQGAIGDDVMRAIERDLDLEELRLAEAPA
jgi:CPA1 family monovalent cation:H+ antiporter